MKLPAPPEGHLRLASYNIRKAVGLDWKRDPGRILHIIADFNADIVVLQEADKRLGPRPSVLSRSIIREELGFDVAPLAVNPVSLGWHGNAVLVRAGLHIARTERIELPGIEPRGAVLVQVATELGEVNVVGVHLGLRRRCRISQVRAIRRHLGEEREPRSVIVGDFNEWNSDVLGPLSDLSITEPGRSFHAALPMLSLDRIVHGPGLRLVDAGVVQTPLTRRASDHLPIWCDLAA